MKCNADTVEMDLMPNHSIRLTIQCASAYEAAIFYEGMSEAAKEGSLVLEFEVTNRRVIYDHTGKRT